MAFGGHWCDLGTLPYATCHALQNRLLERVASGEEPSTLLFVEHPPVLTLGAAFQPSNLLLDRNDYAVKGIEVEETDRGGDVTYHGPRQLVAYPVYDLKKVGQDLHRWLRGLEETVILVLRQYGLEGDRFPPHTGVWVNGRKICAIGIKVRRWVSKHGIALNCDNDLSPFDLIVPCGIRGYGVTSISRELGRAISAEEVRPQLVKSFADVFGLSLEEVSRQGLGRRLDFEPWMGEPQPNPVS